MFNYNRASSASTLPATGNIDIDACGLRRVGDQRAVRDFNCYIGWLEKFFLRCYGRTSEISKQ